MERRLSLPLLGLGLGLLIGLAEAGVALAGTAAHVVNSRRGNAAEIWFVAPVVDGLAGLMVGALAALARRARPGLRWDAAVVAVITALGTYYVCRVPALVFNDTAAILLGLGVAVQATRSVLRNRHGWDTALRRGFPLLLGLPPFLAGAALAERRLAEARAIAALPQPPDGAPNVLLLVMDAQRADRMSAYGYHRPTTPRLEQLAREGIRYANASSASAWTLPSHASLFTGRQLHEHGAGLLDRQYLDRRYPTLAEVLRAAGYATGGFAANVFWTGRHTGLQRGFLHYEDFFGTLGDAVVRTELGRRIRYSLLPWFGWIDLPGRKRAPALNRRLLAWLDRIGDRPFFAFVNYFDVHSPYLAPPPYRGRFSGRALPPHPRGEVEVGRLAGDIAVPPPDSLRWLEDAYDESILFLDASIGALLDSLAARGVLDRTLVVVTSDHGEAHGEHGMMWHGNSLYRHQTWVPLLLRLPGRVPTGVVVSTPVGIEQIPATIARLTGRGEDVFPGPALPLAESGDAQVLALLARRSRTAANWPASRGSLAAWTTSRWHYVELDGDAAELYDLREDPAELVNRAASPSLADTVARFRAALREALAGSLFPWPR